MQLAEWRHWIDLPLCILLGNSQLRHCDNWAIDVGNYYSTTLQRIGCTVFLWISDNDTDVDFHLCRGNSVWKKKVSCVLFPCFSLVQTSFLAHYTGGNIVLFTEHFRAKVASFTDRRNRVMTDVLAGVKLMKIFCWEEPFASLVEESRR